MNEEISCRVGRINSRNTFIVIQWRNEEWRNESAAAAVMTRKETGNDGGRKEEIKCVQLQNNAINLHTRKFLKMGGRRGKVERMKRHDRGARKLVRKEMPRGVVEWRNEVIIVLFSAKEQDTLWQFEWLGRITVTRREFAFHLTRSGLRIVVVELLGPCRGEVNDL